MKVSGIEIDLSTLQAVEKKFQDRSFTLRDFALGLESQGVLPEVSYEGAKRHLQNQRRAGNAHFDKAIERWHLRALKPEYNVPVFETLELTPQDTLMADSELVEDSREPQKSNATITDTIAVLGCIASIGALVFINASFAWEFAETPLFKYALVGALMGCDILRPLFVARGMQDLSQELWVRGFLGILVALSIAPLSILSSTSVLSATMQLGAEQNQKNEQIQILQSGLSKRYERLEQQIEKLWDAHEKECQRGGCGAKADIIEQQAEVAETEAQAVLLELQNLQHQTGPSSFTARTVQAFAELGLFHQGQVVFLPLMIAITLELAALFGPGLLLARKQTTPRNSL